MILDIDQLIEYQNIMTERIKKVTKEDHIIHGYMIYRCKYCGHVYVMNLEKGLEDPTDDAETGNHKPVPFSIICIACGGSAFHIMFGLSSVTYGKNYRSYQQMVDEPNENVFRNFFWNDPESECGVPVVFESDFSTIVLENDTGALKDLQIEMCDENVFNNRHERRHPKQHDGYKRPRSNKKLYEY